MTSDKAGDITERPFRLAGLELDGAVRVNDPAERAKLVRFLRGGEAIMISPDRERDRFDPASDPSVPVGFVTDGTWIWSFALVYYADRHGVAPEPDFYEYIRSRDYAATTPSAEDCERAATFLNAAFFSATDYEAPGTDPPGR